MSARQTYIFVRFSIEGFHSYPGAPEEVKYLRDKHRHIFHYEVTISVHHNDRELEFIMFKDDIKNNCVQGNQNGKSCEVLAHDVIDYIEKNYPNRSGKVSVSEDNENGAIVTFGE